MIRIDEAISDIITTHVTFIVQVATVLLRARPKANTIILIIIDDKCHDVSTSPRSFLSK